MRNLLRLPAVSLLALTLFVGCSNDDEKESEADKTPAADATGVPSADGPQGDQTRSCQATVEVTGATQATWQGRATVRLSETEPSAVYQAQWEGGMLSAYSAFDDNPPTANVSIGEDAFTTPIGDDTGLQVADDGTGASIDADAEGLDDAPVHIVASFTCAKRAKG